MTLASAAELSEDWGDFLRRRIALFGLVGFALCTVMWLFRLVVIVVDVAKLDASFWLHLASGLILLAMAALCRFGPRSRRFVESVELVGLLLACGTLQAMGVFLNVGQDAILIVILSMTYVFVGRAIYVPSTAPRTLIVTALVGVPLIPLTYFGDQPGGADAFWSSVASGVWWLTTSTLATGASKVIYGLRREVREARRLGHYTLEGKLGEGGMGIVYRAKHAMLRRPTAVKLLAPDKIGELSVARFEREVQAAATLTHPNTITIFDYGRTPDGVFYYAMELLDGATLEDVVAIGGPQPAARVLHVLDQVTAALVEAHGLGLVHRDIKPANVMLCTHGGTRDVVKVLDFGLVKELAPSGAAEVTHAGTITGTPRYMPPEAITSPTTVDARSDLYAVGAIGYFLLTGAHVFGGNSVVEVCSHHLHTVPEPPSSRAGRPIPSDLEQLVLTCLEKAPDLRPQSAAALRESVRRCSAFGARTAGHADAWWSEHASLEAAERRQIERLSGQGRTLDVDLALRATEVDAGARTVPAERAALRAVR